MNALNFTVSISLLALLAASPAFAQVPVDDSGEPLATYESMDDGVAQGNEDIPLLTQTELQDLVGPVALYPDDLLALVLPASTFPLQLVEAQRFLEALEQDPSLSPDEDWDDSIIAILNYPEVLELLNEDLDWTWRLGEAVVAQQADVVLAVESFRDRAYAAGNLRSDSHQTVANNEGTIEITPVEDDVIYVPYYEPETVVVYQPRPVYYYYPRAYPVYYYPYPDTHAFNRGFFWGVTTAYTLGWMTDSVHVLHHSYHGHPYYGRSYWNGWWYRRPSVHVHNNYYAVNSHTISRHRYSRGDYWRPRYEPRRRLSNQRVTRSHYYANRSTRDRRSDWNSTLANRTTRTSTARASTARVQPSQRTRDVTPTRRHNYSSAGSTTQRTTQRTTRRTTQPVTTQRTTRRTTQPVTTARATPRQQGTPRRAQFSPSTRDSREDRARQREVVQPRRDRSAQTRQQDTRRSDARRNSGNERRSDARRDPPAAREQPSRSTKRQSSGRREERAADRSGRSRSSESKRQRH